MDFEQFIQQADYDTNRDLIGLCIYYVDQIEDSQPVNTRMILELIESSRVQTISPKALGAHIRYLKSEGIIGGHRSGYRLTHDGIDHYNSYFKDTEDEQRSEDFITVTGIPRGFYAELVEDINLSYRHGIDDGVFVLSRKLLENLVIDILRLRYGLEDGKRELFFNTDRRQFQPFSVLIDNFENRLEDLEYFSDRLDESIIRSLRLLKETGNASAHSIETNPSEDELISFKETTNEVVDLLLFVRSELRATQGNSTGE